ncbi:MAG: DNRLRE domain-containing protein [Deltaproteobacteria bacterium]|nr:DNRLRE domain-containing protein [Deltaproteobacteria bacterium]
MAVLAAGPALADVVSINPSRDNTIYEPESEKSNGAGTRLFSGRTNAGLMRRALIAFDVAGPISAGSTIDAVTLRLNLSRTRAGPETVSLHRATLDWGEGTSLASGQEGAPDSATGDDATWEYRFYDENNPSSSPAWNSLGGTYGASASAATIVGDQYQYGFYDWSSSGMVDDVQAWLDGTEPNYGWFVIGNESGTQTTKRFDSREGGNPPELVVHFTPALVVPAPALSPGGLAGLITMLLSSAALALRPRRASPSKRALRQRRSGTPARGARCAADRSGA